MFKSVGLNIDSPETFFVRQGRITKIVNFKPADLREMIEEAAGIAFYKEISSKCQKNIKRKAETQKTQEERMNRNLGTRLKHLERERQIEDEFDAVEKEIDQKKENLRFLESSLATRQLTVLKEREIEATNELEITEKALQGLAQQQKDLIQQSQNYLKNHEAVALGNLNGESVVDLETLKEELRLKEKDVEIMKNSKKKQKELFDSEQERLDDKLDTLEQLLITRDGLLVDLKAKKEDLNSNQERAEELRISLQEAKETLEEFKLKGKINGTDKQRYFVKNIAKFKHKMIKEERRYEEVNSKVRRLEAIKAGLDNDLKQIDEIRGELMDNKTQIKKKLAGFKYDRVRPKISVIDQKMEPGEETTVQSSLDSVCVENS